MALGRTKIGRRQRAEAPDHEEGADRPDRELESYLAALAPEEDTETTGSGRGFGAAQVYQLRLPLMANERLKELAAQQGTSPDALARDWVMQHLADAEASVPAWPEGDGREPTHGQPHEGSYPSDPYADDPYADDLYTGGGYPATEHSQPWPSAGHHSGAGRPGGQHHGSPQQQYSGQLYPAQGAPYGQEADPYRVEETDTEITIPGDQYRY